MYQDKCMPFTIKEIHEVSLIYFEYFLDFIFNYLYKVEHTSKLFCDLHIFIGNILPIKSILSCTYISILICLCFYDNLKYV